MTEKTVPEKKKKIIRARYEETKPADIVDVWRLFSQSQLLSPQKYPDLTEEQPEFIRSHIFSMISAPNFVGLIAKVGKKPVGQMNGFVTVRPYGAPRVFFQFWLTWVDPEYRQHGIAKLMLSELFSRLKKQGVHHFESITEPELIPQFEKLYGGQLPVVSHRIIGKVRTE